MKLKNITLIGVAAFGHFMIFGAILVLAGGDLLHAIIPMLIGLVCAWLRPYVNRRKRRAELAAVARRADESYRNYNTGGF